MAKKGVKIPDFDFSGFYYPQILQALRNFGRVNVPELTDENEHEPYIQLERAFALVAHLNNVLLDMVARETFLPSARLLESVRNHLKLIGVLLKQATPAKAEIVLELTKIFTTEVELIPKDSLFATEQAPGKDAILFETTKGYTVTPTNDCLLFTEGQIIYIGHKTLMWEQMDFTLSAPASGIKGVWEYYDIDLKKTSPDSVINNGPNLTFKLNSLLGEKNRSASLVRVTHLQSSAYEEVLSLWDGENNYIITSGLLGQSSPSTNPDDYAVGTLWNPMNDADDGTEDFIKEGAVKFPLPQSLTKNWRKTNINGISAYWLRYRVVETTSPYTLPVISSVRIDRGKQYLLIEATQGETVIEDPLSSSNGQPNQEFKLLRKPYIEGSLKIGVDEQEWTQVDNLLNSTPSSRHYTIEVSTGDEVTVRFGNGANGRIPPLGIDNIRAEYRVGASQDGNVGSQSISINKSGIAFIGKIFNPRPAYGWNPKEGSTEEDLARVKIAGPATLRTKTRAVTKEDVVELAEGFLDSGGSKIVSRSLSIEETFGVKTIECVVVGTGGYQLPQSSVEELTDYFNGNPEKKIEGVLVANHQVVVVNYSPRVINIQATVYGGVREQIENILKGLLHPTALKEDGLSYEWDFGGEVPKSRIVSEIFKVQGVRKVILTQPSEDIILAARELPMAGILNITVNP